MGRNLDGSRREQAGRSNINAVTAAHEMHRGGRRALMASLVLAFALVTMVVSASPARAGSNYTAFMTTALSKAATANPSTFYNVVVRGVRSSNTSGVASATASAINAAPAKGAKITKEYTVINGVGARMTGAEIGALAHNQNIYAITVDDTVGKTGYSNTQLWPAVSQVSSFYASAPTGPAIAIVDSGVDASRAADFGARVIASQSFVSSNSNTRGGDGFGHGTFVAGIAADEATGYAGAAPGAKIVSLDVLDDDGQGVVSDVIDAADWIYKNKARYGIRVANFSLLAGSNASFLYDPLDAAVERLWLSGVVVVTAAGNYAQNGQASGVLYAPANDPFVITVGAADTAGTVGTNDDINAPWSAYGYTLDGFAKPELGAPGRYMNGPAPTSSAMYTQHPERVVAPGYMWMSGTSFAAPVVAGAAADLLALNPNLTPDQVKGALMLTAARAAAVSNSYALGVGEVQAASASAVANPPNPNAGLTAYLTTDLSGATVFDAASWSSAAMTNASWNSASWSSASWSSASWSSASWSSASWSSASWSSASWSSGQTKDGSLPAASWSTLVWVG
jgi:serine protease AprX